MIMFQVLNCQC